MFLMKLGMSSIWKSSSDMRKTGVKPEIFVFDSYIFKTGDSRLACLFRNAWVSNGIGSRHIQSIPDEIRDELYLEEQQRHEKDRRKTGNLFGGTPYLGVCHQSLEGLCAKSMMLLPYWVQPAVRT
jgi:hypothetical protein